HLAHEGREQAEKMAERFKGIPVAALYSSPLERAMDTASYLSQVLKLDVQIVQEVSEIDFGEWTGITFEHLRRDPRWEGFNSFRSGTRIPGGESMLEVQDRFVGWMETIRPRYPEEKLIAVSHGDPIKSAVAYYAGLHLDMFDRFDVDLASVTAIKF